MINNKKFSMKHVLHVTNNDDRVKLPWYKSDVLIISNDEYYTKKWTLSYVINKDGASRIINIDRFERM
jgi:hypothetical protein